MIVYRLLMDRCCYGELCTFDWYYRTKAELKRETEFHARNFYQNPRVEEINIPDPKPNDFFKTNFTCGFLTEDAFNAIVLFSDRYDGATIRKPKEFPAFFRYYSSGDAHFCGSWEECTKEEIINFYLHQRVDLQNRINAMDETIEAFKKFAGRA